METKLKVFVSLCKKRTKKYYPGFRVVGLVNVVFASCVTLARSLEWKINKGESSVLISNYKLYLISVPKRWKRKMAKSFNVTIAHLEEIIHTQNYAHTHVCTSSKLYHLVLMEQTHWQVQGSLVALILILWYCNWYEKGTHLGSVCQSPTFLCCWNSLTW